MIDPLDWVVGQFTADDLNKKTVEYSFSNKRGKVTRGKGTLVAAARGCLMRVSILGESWTSMDGNTGTAMAYLIHRSEAGKLVRNPAGSPCEFSFSTDSE